MKTDSKQPQLDASDLRILTELQRNGRLSIAELSERIGLSTTPCWRRVRMLEESGVISRYTAVVNAQALGIALDVFVEVSLDLHQAAAFEKVIDERDEVVECYAVTGDRDYLLHVMVADMDACDRFLRDELIHFPGVQRVSTRLALKPIKQSAGVPLRILP
ncbi:MAG: Lrp/AsnC family transcriptional regulator [Proteobacteria bacterium]|nr:MAG: Lrp/AsnC family transcriptional regulator [Pseudomonadota bacterium]QKK11671.1 MAG: Lrp/AsnC family transcriptional regulator [Pseudomonadota bacterium]